MRYLQAWILGRSGVRVCCGTQRWYRVPCPPAAAATFPPESQGKRTGHHGGWKQTPVPSHLPTPAVLFSSADLACVHPTAPHTLLPRATTARRKKRNEKIQPALRIHRPSADAERGVKPDRRNKKKGYRWEGKKCMLGTRLSYVCTHTDQRGGKRRGGVICNADTHRSISDGNGDDEEREKKAERRGGISNVSRIHFHSAWDARTKEKKERKMQTTVEWWTDRRQLRTTPSAADSAMMVNRIATYIAMTQGRR